MRECQLCGAKSWGPIEGKDQPKILTLSHLWGTEIDFSRYAKCDNCDALALKRIVETPEQPDPEKMMATFIGRMPIPETRLERIVRSIIQAQAGTGLRSQEWAEYTVLTAARAIEAEMDRADPNPYRPAG
jgi:hypothetical protein